MLRFNLVDTLITDMRFKVISFDVEGTLTTHRFSEVIWEQAIPRLYSEKKGISLREAISYVFNEYEKVGNERIEWYDIRYWFDYFGLDDYKNLLAKYKHEISYYPEVRKTLEELSKNYRLIISSNSPREFLELEIEKIKVYFNKIFSAPSDFKQVKTADFYKAVCDILGIKFEDMVHVGDHWNYDFVVPRKTGIYAFYLDRKGKSNEFVVNNLRDFKIKLRKLET